MIKKTATKAVAAFAGIALAATVVVSPVQAQTTAELQAQISALLAQIAALQASAGVSTSTACPADPNTIARTLTPGSTGADVMAVQKLMNYFASSKGLNTRVAVSGAGSPGMESSYYGPATAQAVMNFQANYSAEILVPNGLTAPTPNYGPATNAQVKALCAAAPSDDDDDDDDDSDADLSGGEASLEGFTLDSEDDAEEGESAHVATAEFDVEDGDVEINRVDIEFVAGNNTTEDEPWDAFETLTLVIDGEEVAEEDINDEDDWLDEDSPFVFRVSGLDYVAREGDTVEMEIWLTAMSNVDDAGDTDKARWTISIDDEGIRAVDSEGIQNYVGEGDGTEDVTFDIEEEGGNESIEINTSPNDPDASTLMVDDEDESDWYEVFVFELEADENDIDLEEVVLTVVTTGNDYNDIVEDAMITIDGEDFDDFDVDVADPDAAVLTFDIDGDFTVDADEEVEVVVSLQFKDTNNQARYQDGDTVEVRTVSVEGEGVDDVEDIEVVSGEEHTLRASGLFVDEYTYDVDSTTNDNGEVVSAKFTMTFDVTAFDQDVYIPMTIARGTSAVAGITYQIEDSSNDDVAANDANVASAFTSSADDDGTYFIVDEGTSEEFTLILTVTDENTAADLVPGYIRAQLLELNYADDAEAAESQYDFLPANDFDTSVVNIEVAEA